ncbi:MAG: hypothetical protein ACI4HO_00100 [Ruminococcus sp.]
MKSFENIFKPASESFQYTVRQSIKEAQLYERKTKIVKHPVRVVVAAVLMIAIIPTSVFAGTQLFSTMRAEKEERGVELKIDNNQETKSPKYVKLHVKAPKGFGLSKHTEKYEELFYSRTNDTYKGGFSFYLSRPEGKRPKELLDNVSNYEEIIINGHQAVVSKPEDKDDYTRVAIYFENVNIILINYLSPDLTKKEMDYIIDNVKVTKGTKTDHTNYNETVNTTEKAEVNNNSDYKYKIFPVKQGEKIDFGRMNLGNDGTGKPEYYNYPANIVSNIRVVDSINGLNKNNFYTKAGDYADKNGNILSRVIKYSTDEKGNATENKVNQKLILADITIINSDNKETVYYLDYHIDILTRDIYGELRYSDYYSQKDDHDDEDDYAVYIDESGANRNNKEFRNITLQPNETKKVTVGFLCDEDQVSNAYLSTICCNNEEALKYFKKHHPDMMYFSVKVIE